MPQHNKIAIYLPDHLLTEVSSRGDNRSGIISRDLERLYTLYRRALAQVPLKVEEACLIVDALNGAKLEADTARLLWAEIEDAINLDHLDEKWQVDGSALVQKLRQLTDTQALALIDAAERFWEAADVGQRDVREAVREYFNIA
ncbi:MAG: hypothetical protein PWP65_2105 [Clostridia bacterium]|jgi:hypothetical protein|nr:hypothetical protein [Clostridia bacterium]